MTELLTEQDQNRVRELIAAYWEIRKVLPQASSAHEELVAGAVKLLDEVGRLKAKIAEFLDGENHHEQYPPAP